MILTEDEAKEVLAMQNANDAKAARAKAKAEKKKADREKLRAQMAQG
jgi:hypothetical protein